MVDYLVFDVIETYKELVCWSLTIWPVDKPKMHPLLELDGWKRHLYFGNMV